MNVNDFKSEVSSAPCMLQDIWERQWLLIEKYHPIEKKNGLLLSEDMPLNLHDRMAQARIKDMAWRVTEEMAEATGALEDHPDLTDHFHEELSDALHFLVELLISVNIGPAQFTPCGITGDRLIGCYAENVFDNAAKTVYSFTVGDKNEIWKASWQVIHELGQAMNCLKNKPWKQSHMLTDVNKFGTFMIRTFGAFLRLCAVAGMNERDIHDMYTRKNKVNQFRQRSAY